MQHIVERECYHDPDMDPRQDVDLFHIRLDCDRSRQLQ